MRCYLPIYLLIAQEQINWINVSFALADILFALLYYLCKQFTSVIRVLSIGVLDSEVLDSTLQSRHCIKHKEKPFLEQS